MGQLMPRLTSMRLKPDSTCMRLDGIVGRHLWGWANHLASRLLLWAADGAEVDSTECAHSQQSQARVEQDRKLMLEKLFPRWSQPLPDPAMSDSILARSSHGAACAVRESLWESTSVQRATVLRRTVTPCPVRNVLYCMSVGDCRRRTN